MITQRDSGTPFEKQNLLKIVGHKMDRGEAYLEVNQDGNQMVLGYGRLCGSHKRNLKRRY